MTVNVDNHEQLTDVVGWVYLTNKWSIGQTRIIIHNVGDISYTQLISGNVHLRFPVLVRVKDSCTVSSGATSSLLQERLEYSKVV